MSGLGRLKKPRQRYLQEVILIRISKMRFNIIRWQGLLYYLFNKGKIKIGL